MQFLEQSFFFFDWYEEEISPATRLSPKTWVRQHMVGIREGEAQKLNGFIWLRHSLKHKILKAKLLPIFFEQ